MRIPLVGGWDEDPLWARFYPLMVEHPVLGAPLWRVGLGSDITRLYAAAREITDLPAGSRVLDVPVGGGVALRGLRAGGGLDYVAADISPRMLERAADTARRRGVEDQVTTTIADVGALPFEDGSFDLVVSFTGLHVFPDPRQAIHEMVRVLRPGAAITGSALLFSNDFRGLDRRYELVRLAGRASQVLGPMCSADDARAWLAEAGAVAVRLDMSGAVGYFHATKA